MEEIVWYFFGIGFVVYVVYEIRSMINAPKLNQLGVIKVLGDLFFHSSKSFIHFRITNVAHGKVAYITFSESDDVDWVQVPWEKVIATRRLTLERLLNNPTVADREVVNSLKPEKDGSMIVVYKKPKKD